MSKNIILLSDGTGKANVIKRGTNVFKLYEAIDFNIPNCKQVAFYDDGVGTQEFKPLKILGGVFGWGLARNVRQLYKELVQTYTPGDKIYLFGFSRGAFTVRTLAGLIATMGVLDHAAYADDETLDTAVWQCYQQYRSTKQAVLERYFYKLPSQQLVFLDAKPDIEFIGVWDTVDAVGLPFAEAADFLNHFIFRFKFEDHSLHEKIKRAYHAIAIDEARQTFQPLLWENDSRIEQVWFPGVHGNVGGGYPQQGLSFVALDWMMEKAQAAGLRFIRTDLDFVKDRAYVFDRLYNSRAGLNVYYRFSPRNIALTCADKMIMIPKIHVSVFERIAQGVFGYAPGNLPTTFEVVDHAGTHKHSATIARMVGEAVADMRPQSLLLLDQAAAPIKARRLLYYVLLCYSFFTLYWLVRGDLANPAIGLFGTLKILVSPDGLLDKLAVLFWDHPLFIIIGAILFAGSVVVRQKIERIFATFWSKLRSDLGKLVQ
jgi:hypothetical protein